MFLLMYRRSFAASAKAKASKDLIRKAKAKVKAKTSKLGKAKSKA